jgi:hypothetical protein
MSETESDLLNEWFAGQRHYRTWNELATYLGVDKRVISQYHTGTRQVNNPDHRALLFKVTKIPAFANEKPAEPPSADIHPKVARAHRAMGNSERSSGLVVNGVTLRTREELSYYLKRWLEGQPKGTTVAELARMTRIPESTFSNYFSGHGFPGVRNRTEFVALIERLTPSEQQIVVDLAKDNQKKRQMMAEGTEVELKDLINKVLSKFQQLTEEIHRMKDGGEKAARTPSEHAERVLALLYSLDRELQYFRNASVADRDYLRRIVHGQDVGYITSLLRALYDEDKFQSWQLFANYQMVSRGGDQR